MDDQDKEEEHSKDGYKKKYDFGAFMDNLSNDSDIDVFQKETSLKSSEEAKLQPQDGE